MRGDHREDARDDAGRRDTLEHTVDVARRARARHPRRPRQSLRAPRTTGPAWLLRHARVQFHFTPTYASWLNLVERFLGLLTEKALRRGSHTSIAQLRAAILAYVDAHNDRGTPFT